MSPYDLITTMLLLLKFLKKTKLLKYLELNVRQKTIGLKIPIKGDIGYNLLFDDENWMQHLINALSRFKKGSFMDIGANIGQTLLKVKTSQYHNNHYYGFEPNPNCVEYLSRLIDVNALEKCEIFPVAVGERDGLQELYYHGNQVDSSASLIKKFRKSDKVKKQLVPVSCMKSIRKFMQEDPGIVKIDVEGYEYEVLRAMKDFINTTRPFIICEILPVYDETFVERITNQNNIIQLMNELKYAVFRIMPGQSLMEIDEIEIHDKIEWSNYLFSPFEIDVKIF